MMIEDMGTVYYHYCGQKFTVTIVHMIHVFKANGKEVGKCPICGEDDLQSKLNRADGFYSENEWFVLMENPFWNYICNGLNIDF